MLFEETIVKESPEAPVGAKRHLPLSRFLPIPAVIVIGAGVTLAFFLFQQASEKSRLKSEFASLASDRALVIQDNLAEDFVEEELIARYVWASSELAGGDPGLFASELGRIMDKVTEFKPDDRIVAFIARVVGEGRNNFEAHARSGGDGTFRIQERSPAGSLAPAAERAEYFPVTIIKPDSYRGRLVGFDLASSPILLNAIERAIDSGKVTVSGAADFPASPPGEPRAWHFLAVYSRPLVAGVRPPRSELLGLVGICFRIGRLMEEALANVTPAGIDLELSDPSAAPDRRQLYYFRTRFGEAGAVPADKRGWMSWKTAIDAGGHDWILTEYPTPRFLEIHRSLQSWIILAAGLLLTAAGGAFFASRTRRTFLVESLVVARTNDLALEIDKHRQLEAELADSKSILATQVNRLNRRSREIQLLNEMGDTLQACVSTEEAYPVVALYVSHLLPGTAGALYMSGPEDDLFVSSAEWGTDRPSASAFRAEDCWALRRGKAHLVGTAALALPCSHASKLEDQGSLCIPLSATGKTIGLFHLVGAVDDAQDLAISVADRIGLALSNLMLRSDLRQLSIRDPLTGLFNRRYMEEALEIEMYRAERRDTTIGVIMLDIDHFKTYNDEFGHGAGDEVLRTLGELVLTCMRAGNIACRYGGEEFILFLPETSAQVAAARAEDIRRQVKTLDLRAQERSLGAVTVSLGVAMFPIHAKSREALFAAVDACLYKAKAAGRDRVVVAEVE